MSKIQIGVSAYIDPKTGKFLPAEPIFEERTEENDLARDRMIRFAGKLIGEWMGEANALNA